MPAVGTTHRHCRGCLPTGPARSLDNATQSSACLDTRVVHSHCNGRTSRSGHHHRCPSVRAATSTVTDAPAWMTLWSCWLTTRQTRWGLAVRSCGMVVRDPEAPEIGYRCSVCRSVARKSCHRHSHNALVCRYWVDRAIIADDGPDLSPWPKSAFHERLPESYQRGGTGRLAPQAVDRVEPRSR